MPYTPHLDTAVIPDVESQIGAADYDTLRSLIDQLQSRRFANRERLDYYEMRNLFRDLNIAIPPVLRHLEVAMGWPAKAVDLLARRVKLEGFVLPGADVADWGIPDIWDANRMDVDAPQAITSALINPPAFLSATLGDVASGEPDVLVTMSDAMQATGLWNPAKRGLSASLQVLASDENGWSRIIMLTPERAIGMTRTADFNRWDVRVTPHGLGRVPLEPLVYRPHLTRPFGSSRISRAVKSITNSAMRTIVRSEVGAEFFITPQRYLLGADEDMFEDENGNRKSTWDLVMGRILSIPNAVDSETGEPLEMPKVGQFPQVAMTPHAEHLRMWATMFAGETGLSLSSLGVVQDNPSSAEAIYAAKEDLILEAEGCADGFAPAFIRTMLTGVQMRDNLAAIPDDLKRLGVRWRDPSTPSRAAATDAVMKQVSAGIIPAESDVALEALGFDDTTIARIQADRRRAAGRAALAAIRRPAPAAPGDQPATDQPETASGDVNVGGGDAGRQPATD